MLGSAPPRASVATQDKAMQTNSIAGAGYIPGVFPSWGGGGGGGAQFQRRAHLTMTRHPYSLCRPAGRTGSTTNKPKFVFAELLAKADADFRLYCPDSNCRGSSKFILTLCRSPPCSLYRSVQFLPSPGSLHLTPACTALIAPLLVISSRSSSFVPAWMMIDATASSHRRAGRGYSSVLV